MRKIKVGIIQQANTADLRTNLMNLAKSIEACAGIDTATGCITGTTQFRCISVRLKTRNCLVLRKHIPRPCPPDFIPNWQLPNKIVFRYASYLKIVPGLLS